jgi:hypothetical protein
MKCAETIRCDRGRIMLIYKNLALKVEEWMEHCIKEFRSFLYINQQSEERKITVSMLNSL